MSRINTLFSKLINSQHFFDIFILSAMTGFTMFAPDVIANAPALPDIGSGGANDLLAQSAGVTQDGMFYAIWVVGILLIFVPAYFLIGAFADWVKGRKELGEVGGVIIVGVVIVVAGMWLLSTASTLTTSGITGN